MTGDRGRRRLVGSILGDMLRGSPRLVVTVTSMRLAAAILAPLDAVAFGLLVDAGRQGHTSDALAFAALFAVADAGSSAFNHPAGKLELTLREKTQFVFERRLLRLSTAAGTLEHLERPDYHDRVEVARNRSASLGELVVRLIELAQAVVLMTVVLIALLSVHPALLALIVAAVPAIYLAGGGEVARARAEERNIARLRLADRLFALATTAGPVKEVKVHRAERMIRDRFEAATGEAIRVSDRAEIRAVALTVTGWLIFSLAFVTAMAFVVHEAIGGRATPGQVLIVLTLSIRLNEQVHELGGAVAGVRRAARDVRRVLWLYEAVAPAPAPEPELVPPSPRSEDKDILLKDVTFRYPGTDVDVLRGVTLRLPAGSTVALVGDNGAGKSTLVKLLCGLYAPTSGRITAGGQDLSAPGRAPWVDELSGSFQDFVRFELMLREAVGVGRLASMHDETEVWAAVDRAAARSVADTLPSGLATQLGAQWPDGRDLSLGQWQKVALARAMMRRHPTLLVLDEPSASLDTAAEHALYERFSRASEFDATSSAITLLVSHRFSTVLMADIIVLLRDGRVTEVGSHSELMRIGGTYAELFELQERGYRR